MLFPKQLLRNREIIFRVIIKGELPEEVIVAHKTGSSGANKAGNISLLMYL